MMNRNIPTVAVIFGMLLCAGVGWAGPPLNVSVIVQGPNEGRFEDLKLELKVEPLEVLVGQAVRVTATLSNPTQVAIEGHDDLSPAGQLCDLYVAEGDRQPQLTYPPVNAINFLDFPTRPLPPGYSHTEDYSLWLKSEPARGTGPVFERPGQYSLKLVLRTPRSHQTTESNAVTVTVLEPGGRDQEAWQCVETEQTRSGRFPLYWDVEWTRAFVASFADTSYAPYGWYGISLRTDSWPDVPESLHALEEALAYPGFALRPDVLYELVLSYLHRLDLHANTLGKEAPDSVLTEDVRETLRHALARWRHP